MTDLVFFYGTLMSGFKRPAATRLDSQLDAAQGRGWIHATLFDLGIYPAAIPAADGRVWGEVHRMTEVDAVLARARSRSRASGPTSRTPACTRGSRRPVTFDDGHTAPAWAYFYNAPLGRAQRIESGDYLEHLKVK